MKYFKNANLDPIKAQSYIEKLNLILEVLNFSEPDEDSYYGESGDAMYTNAVNDWNVAIKYCKELIDTLTKV
jgi:hypothetical protein